MPSKINKQPSPTNPQPTQKTNPTNPTPNESSDDIPQHSPPPKPPLLTSQTNQSQKITALKKCTLWCTKMYIMHHIIPKLPTLYPHYYDPSLNTLIQQPSTICTNVIHADVVLANEHAHGLEHRIELFVRRIDDRRIESRGDR
jgi:hypothetical protein